MPKPWTRVVAVASLMLAGCQSGMLPQSKATPALAATPAAPAVIAKDAPASKTAEAPRIEPGNFAEGYRQPKGSAIPPRIPMGMSKTLPTSAVKQASAVK